MAEKVTNLRLARKRKAREDARSDADARAVRFGESKTVRSFREAQKAKDIKDLDGKKRE